MSLHVWTIFAFFTFHLGCKTDRTTSATLDQKPPACTVNGVGYTAEDCADWDAIKACINTSCTTLRADLETAGHCPDRLGEGFIGNWKGGAKCIDVHETLYRSMQKCLPQNYQGDLRACSVTKMGVYVNQHIYLGICRCTSWEQPLPTVKPRCIDGRVISWFDPWRYADCQLYKPETGPHSKKHKITIW